MNDPREILNRIRKQADAATDGPWEAFGTVIDAFTGPGDCPGCSGILSPAHEPACYYSEIAGAGEQDAEFIAAARTAVPALLDALEKVLELADQYDSMARLERREGDVSESINTQATADRIRAAITAALEGETHA